MPLFDYEAFHEAVLNAFVHNKWLGLNAPMISVFTDRIEILSHGGLGIEQDLEGFYSGVSIPVNEVLASIFLQLRLSERSGRGVPKIVGAYGRESIRIEKNFIVVTIPFNRINVTPFELNMGEKSEIQDSGTVNEPVNELLAVLAEKPHLPKEKLAGRIGKSRATVTRLLAKLVADKKIRRVGADKNGYWEILQ